MAKKRSHFYISVLQNVYFLGFKSLTSETTAKRLEGNIVSFERFVKQKSEIKDPKQLASTSA